MSKVIVIGAGAAGCMAAIAAAEHGHQVTVLEKNEKVGKKLYITGKGRCNLCNACETQEFFTNVISNPKFLYSAFYGFDNQKVVEFFEAAGVKLKTERGNRVFPQSDKSADILDALKRRMKALDVAIRYNTEVIDLIVEENIIKGVVLDNHSKFYADCVILCAGGKSYPQTGSTGDFYKILTKYGHTVTELKPALVPLTTDADWVMSLQGLSLKNVVLRATIGKKVLYEELGEMLFTHFGISGPLVLSLSSYLSHTNLSEVSVELDMKPALSEEVLDERLLRDLDEHKNKQIRNAFQGLLPIKMLPITLSMAGISEYTESCQLKKEERRRYVQLLKHIPIPITGTRSFTEAIITSGGINTKEINPKTMESKIIKNLFFAGEIIDVDALTGGFNLQIAWSTGHLAGDSIE